MSFVIGFACGILAPWMVYRVKQMISDTKVCDEEMNKAAEEIFAELEAEGNEENE